MKEIGQLWWLIMLSFKELQEKKTKVIINPKKDQVMEGSCGDKDMKKNHGEDCDCMKCDKKRRKEELGDETTMSTEEAAYVSQEEVTEESNKESDSETKLLTFNQYNNEESINERTRYAKRLLEDPQTGNESKKGGTMKGSAMAAVRKDLVKSGGLMSSRKKPINPQGKKQVKGKKSDVGTGKYKRWQTEKRNNLIEQRKQVSKTHNLMLIPWLAMVVRTTKRVCLGS